MKLFLAAGAAALVVCAGAPQAQAAARYSAETRQLAGQINQGVRDGSLTPSETRTLRLELIAAEVKEAHDTKDGYSKGIDQDITARYAIVAADIHALRINDQRVIIRHPQIVRHRQVHHLVRKPVHKATHKTTHRTIHKPVPPK